MILCGGSGTRLWPVSRSLMPKQYAPLFEGQSLFRKTVVTNSAVCESQFIVSNADQFFLAKDQLKMEGMTGSKFLLEPVCQLPIRGGGKHRTSPCGKSTDWIKS